MIAIIDYGAGNVKSVQNAVAKLGYESVVTADHSLIKSADKIIFPGVGEASSAMAKLKEKGLDILIPTLEQPFLGICLGQQLLCSFSEEGNVEGMGIFDAKVKKFPTLDIVPHMGWNNIQNPSGSLFNKITPEDNFYFVHSYYCELSSDTISVCEYILPFSATFQKNNFFGTQFHPEKSGEAGSQLLKNFLNIEL